MNNTWLRYIMMCVVTLTLIAPLLGGCGGRVTEPKLVRADSLMDAAPDSALALLLTIDSSRLDGRANQAYYALLLTQARYKCYIPATGDSLINIAVDYYDHWYRDRNKRTRSLLFKGCVMEELDTIESALVSYLQAKSVADEKDYYNLGQINYRIGNLFNMYYDFSERTLHYYEESLKCFELQNNKFWTAICLNDMGNVIAATKPKKGIALLKRSAKLFDELNDTDRFVNTAKSLSNCCFYDSSFVEAKNWAMLVINQFPEKISDAICYSAASAYARLGMADSAQFVFDKTSPDSDDVMIIMRTRAQREIALCKKDYAAYTYYKELNEQISEPMINSTEKSNLARVELNFEQQQASSHSRQSKSALTGIVLIAALLILVIVCAHHRKMSKLNKLLVSLKKSEAKSHQELLSKIAELENMGTEIGSEENKLNGLHDDMNEMIRLLREIFKTGYQSPENQFLNNVQSIMRRIKQNEDQEFCRRFYHFVDVYYNNIITETQKRYPGIKNQDIFFIALSCSGFSYLEITFCMGYTNPTYVSGKRKRIAQSMGLKCSLEEYISSFVSGNSMNSK